jgi:CheY-like chemotaxis protein
MPVSQDDRDSIQEGDRVVLVVDNDLGFAGVLLDLARERGYKALTTAFGAAAIAMARERQPDAITLDICLPDIDGWYVLDRLKHDLATRHIPVFVITTEEDAERAFALGAVGVLTKPVHTKDALSVVFTTLIERSARPQSSLVIVGPDDVAQQKLRVTLEDGRLVIHTLRTWDEAKTLLERQRMDCLAIDGATCEKALADLAGLPDHPQVPIAVFAPKGLSKRAERQVKRLSARQAVRVAQSPERLIDDTALLLHRPFESLPEAGRAALERLYRGDAVLAGRTVLIVDDDIRNIFAMTSVLEGCQMSVISAEGGKEGIEKLQKTPGVDIVLMDIMMPDMDGYDTMRAIRRIPAFKSLPIVAVTAKAMKGDREKCIEAGAWDYLPKPVDSEQLLSVFRTWLHR